jgi:predicted nucleotidyltransferase
MKIESENRQEQLIRQVTEIGNGAHIFAPKEWMNEKVLIVRLEKKSIKEEILGMLYPYLDKIITVLLYGSHGRGEADKDSDIDVLVIAKDKFKLDKKPNIECVIISEDFLNSAIEINPIMMYSIFREAIPIINQDYLEKLRKIKINPKFFKQFIYSTKESIKSSEEIIELDKKTGKTASNSIIYSLILRLRGVFIINQLLADKIYSNELFKKWITNNCKINYSKIYEVYRIVRAEKEIKDKIFIGEAEILIRFLKEELKKLELIMSEKLKCNL